LRKKGPSSTPQHADRKIPFSGGIADGYAVRLRRGKTGIPSSPDGGFPFFFQVFPSAFFPPFLPDGKIAGDRTVTAVVGGDGRRVADHAALQKHGKDQYHEKKRPQTDVPESVLHRQSLFYRIKKDLPQTIPRNISFHNMDYYITFLGFVKGVKSEKPPHQKSRGIVLPRPFFFCFDRNQSFF